MDTNSEDIGSPGAPEHAVHDHNTHEHNAHEHNIPGHDERVKRDWSSIAIYGIAVLAIFAIAVFIRIRMLNIYGFFEPDGYYHYSVIRAAVNNGFQIPNVLGISGWPVHGIVGEPHGLYWITLIPYFFLQFFGISYYTIMRLMPVLFGLFNVIGAYYLSRYVSKDKLFGLLVMALVALSLGDSARTSALVYRGDSFITIFVILSLMLAIETLRQKDGRKKLYLAIATGVMLSFCNIVWNGAAFAFATVLFGFILLTVISFIFDKEELLKSSGYLLASFAVWYLLVNFYRLALGWVTSIEAFTGVDSILLLILVAAGWFSAYYLARRRHSLSSLAGTKARRLAVASMALVVGFSILEIVAPSIVYSIFIGNGFITITNFGATIEELQAPSPSYFYQSFGVVLATTPMTLLMYLTSYLHSVKVFIWLLVMLSFALYFFMHIEGDGEGFLSGRPSIKPSIRAEMVLLMAYLGLTSYLQIHVIRFNSIVAVPIAIFSAYTIYWLIAYAKKTNRKPVYYASFIPLLAMLALLSYQAVSYTSHLYPADAINNQFIQALQWMKANTPANGVVLTIWPDGSVVEGVANRTSVTDSVGAQRNSIAGPFAAWILGSDPDGQFLTSNITGRPDYLLVRSTWLLETSGIFTEAGINSSLAQSYGYTVLSQFAEGQNATDRVIKGTDGQQITTVVDFRNETNGTKSVSSALFFGNQYVPISYFAMYDQSTLNYSIFNLTKPNATASGDMILLLYSDVPRPGYFLNVTGTMVFGSLIATSNLLSFIYFCNNNQCRWNSSIAGMRLVYQNPDTKIYRINYNS
ncbi:MAG: hypothetical protein KGH50_03475 [Candidatus Micrarchaeota archaeon]|nr:hypothetical protein [Candidatus Micrarchaeota archaeon]